MKRVKIVTSLYGNRKEALVGARRAAEAGVAGSHKARYDEEVIYRSTRSGKVVRWTPEYRRRIPGQLLCQTGFWLTRVV